MGMQDENVKPLNSFVSQQVPFRANSIEEEGSVMEEEVRPINTQYVEVYVQEIFNYLRDVEVLIFIIGFGFGLKGGFGICI